MSLDISLGMAIDTGGRSLYPVNLYDGNYTHNVVPMWKRAGVYKALYRSTGKTAAEILPTLEAGISAMEKDPAGFFLLNPSNGWGSYRGALAFLREVRDACKRHPKAIVEVSA